MILLDGKQTSAKIKEEIAAQVSAMKQQNKRTPHLAAVLVGSDGASMTYVGAKVKACQLVGFESTLIELPEETSEDELLNQINDLNTNPKIDGFIVQLPLPKHIDQLKVLMAIGPDKDVDGFHLVNVGRLSTGAPGLVPCTPFGCLMLLKDELGDLSGKNAVVVGRSNIVGKPMAALLLGESCTVTVAHSRTQDLPEVCRAADILVAAVGRAEMIPGDWVKPGAVVIDVGINRIDTEDGKTRLVGDVDYASAEAVAGAITPVPGGVGPMTIACLLRNTVQAACAANGIEFTLD